MTVTPVRSQTPKIPPKIRWEALPPDFKLDDEPVENTGQPLLAGALHESLSLAGYIQPEMLVASNFGLCATINDKFIAKAPDWVYVASVYPHTGPEDRKSYTPHLEGDIPTVVLEFLSDRDGSEYSKKETYPPGKWFYYEQILKIPYYGIFEPVAGALEWYRLENGTYQLEQPDENGRNWLEEMGLFIGAWRGQKLERNGYWLRWWDEDGMMLPWEVEHADQQQQRADQQQQRADQQQQRADQQQQRADQQQQRADQQQQRAERERQEKERVLAEKDRMLAENQRLLEYLRLRGIDPDQLP